MERSTAIVGVPGCRNKPTVPAGERLLCWRVGTAVGGVRLLGHQITSPPEQRRVILLVTNQNGAWSDVGPGLLPTHRAVAADGEPEEVLDEIAVNCGEDGRRLVDHPQLKANGSSTHTQACSYRHATDMLQTCYRHVATHLFFFFFFLVFFF